MSANPPQVMPRRSSGARVTPKEQPLGGLVIHSEPGRENGTNRESNDSTQGNAEREVEILNHCFEDVEKFIARLQQAAEAKSILDQRAKKKSRSTKKGSKETGDFLTKKACPPSEEEFTSIFQKIKYSLCLLHRLQASIAQPSPSELLHHVFLPLQLLVNTTGGTTMAASVVSPGMTKGAVAMLQNDLTAENKQLWTSLGTNWTSPCSDISASTYAPVFLDGWQPPKCDSTGKIFQDPIQLQFKHEAAMERQQTRSLQKPNAQNHGEAADTVDGNGLAPEGTKYYRCSYDFVARNSSELSVLQGEILAVINSTKRWWKCQNHYDQIGFVPYNILEPAPDQHFPEKPKTRTASQSQTSPLSSSPAASSTTGQGQMMLMPPSNAPGEESGRVLIMNDELLRKLAEKRASVHEADGPSTPTSPQLNYHSQPTEVKAWLTAKGFSQEAVHSLGILNAAQLFSLTEEELSTVLPEEGSSVYSSILIEKALLEDIRKASEQQA
ncbi:epidermal growth factor receptor kinase substrate 8-like protein 1 isoform X1 [Oryzias latipes]|uniref:EPS8 signaling adaptor L1a n=1 Tax=Oryzias latipes TaxID=8090 RepID=H2M6K1_ORYLA|nr:epidermal growth factor receptor kinase substrate 8-like protein 1 isoform X1 [Oryzias latipes]